MYNSLVKNNNNIVLIQKIQKVKRNLKTFCKKQDIDTNEQRLIKRWDFNLSRGTIKQFYPNEQLQKELEQGEWKILDVRPEFEYMRVRLSDAIHIPLFSSEHNYIQNPGIFFKQLICLGVGGLWQGYMHTELNTNFMYYIHHMFNRNDKILVVCQQGLRSLAAADQLYIEGFKNVAILNGGLNKCHEYLKTIEEKDARYGDVGGIQGFLGLTKTQNQLEKGFGKGGHLFRMMCAFLVVDLMGLLGLYLYNIIIILQQNQ